METQPKSEIRRPGLWLRLAQVLWVVLTVAFVGVLVAGIQPRIAELEEVCEGDDCGLLTIAPVEAEILQERGLSVRDYATFQVGAELFMALMMVSMAVIIFWRRSDAWIGLLVSIFLVTFGTNFLGETDAALASIYPALDPFVEFMDALTFVFFLVIFYLFPDGRFVPRWTLWPSLVIVLLVMRAPFAPLFNPLTQEGFSNALGFVFFAYIVGGVVSQIYRYRRVSDIEQQQQTKWIVLGLASTAISIVTFMAGFFFIGLPPGPFRLAFSTIGMAVLLVMLAVLPISFAVSILRYRLWDIDFIFSRALLYGILTVVLTAVWVITTTVINQFAQQALGATSAATASLISTVVIVGIFQPVRTTIEDWVNERFSPISRELAEGLNEFGSFYLARVDLPGLLDIILGRICALMGTASGVIYLNNGSGTFEATQARDIGASNLSAMALPDNMHDRWGRARTVEQEDGEEFGLLVPIHIAGVHEEEVIAIMALGPREGDRGYSRDERRGLADFGGQAGKAIHAVQFAIDRRRGT